MKEQVLFVTDSISGQEKDIIRSIKRDEDVSITLCCPKESVNRDDGIMEYADDFFEYDSVGDLSRLVINGSFGKAYSSIDYSAALMLHTGIPVTYICRRIIRLSDCEPLDKLVMENYVIREADEIIFHSEEDEQEAAGRYQRKNSKEKSTGDISLKNKIIIFGAGAYGTGAFKSLRDCCDIVAFADNNPKRKGTYLYDVPIILGEELKEYDLSDTDVIISIKNYAAIVPQLLSYGIKRFYIMLDGFLFAGDEYDNIRPVEAGKHDHFKKTDTSKPSVLYVQNAACIRTHKTASVIKESGMSVYHLYMLAPPDEANADYKDVYEKSWGFTSFEGVFDFIDNSEFDLIHCSNEPDLLTNIALLTDKPVISDTHDPMSLRADISRESEAFEWIANVKADGNMYTSARITNWACNKFGIPEEKVLTIENLVLDEVDYGTGLEKLSASDNEIHCVYEGSIDVSSKTHHRYFEDIWNKLTDAGIHVHIYSQSEKEYCKNLEKKNPYYHFEGNFGGRDLIRELTKYDVGLSIFNVNDRNRDFLEFGSANKIFEYLNSGIPIALGQLQQYREFLNEHDVGEIADLDGDIKTQFKRISQIPIKKGYLKEHGLTIRSNKDSIRNFYNDVISKKGAAE